MGTSNLLSEVQEEMIDVFDIDDIEITPETTAKDIEAWDSLSHIRLMVAIERKFGIKFSNSEMEGLNNVGELVALIERKLD